MQSNMQTEKNERDAIKTRRIKRELYPKVTYTTLNIGVDHRFNDQWSGAVIFGYEPHKGLRTNEWRPTDGFKSATLAASYQASDKIKITAGISYVDIGDAVTDTYLSHFSGNYGWGGGVRVGIRF